MKVKANGDGRGRIDNPQEAVDEYIWKAFPKSDHIKETEIIRILKPLLDKVTEDDIKIYNFGEGARMKIQFTQYPTICQNNRQLFDVTGLFKTMSQIDALAHKLGSDLLQYLYIIRKDIIRTRRSMRFAERENERNFRGQLCLLHDDIKILCDFLNRKIISQSKFDRNLSDLIEDFETEKEMSVAARFVDAVLEDGELMKSKSRISSEKHRKYTAKYSGLKKIE